MFVCCFVFDFCFVQAGLDIERRYLVANKIDLIEERQVDEDLGQRVCQRAHDADNNEQHVHCSSLLIAIV
jgi:hypothetical protein